GDDQRGLCPAGVGQGLPQLGPVVVVAGLDFRVAGQDLAVLPLDVGRHRGVLGLDPQAGIALLVARYPVVRDELRHGRPPLVSPPLWTTLVYVMAQRPSR